MTQLLKPRGFSGDRPGVSMQTALPASTHQAPGETVQRNVLSEETQPLQELGHAIRREPLDYQAFHAELRQSNLPLLFWTLAIFNPVYLAWTVFDFLLARDHWLTFLILRLIAVSINTFAAVLIFRFDFRKRTWEGFWTIVFVYAVFVAPMLALVDSRNLSRYTMGYAMVIFGAGLIPIWRPRWLVSCLFCSLSVSAVVFGYMWTRESTAIADIIASIFVMVTSTGFAVAGAAFKYNAARRDYISRLRLAAVARGEMEARVRLAETSSALQSALEKLKELARIKSNFFANVSHELRTPLTLILAPLEELSKLQSSDEGSRQVRVIRRNAERLLGLIDDLLDLSRVDAGGLRLNLVDLDVRTIVSAVFENSEPAAKAKALDFGLELGKGDQTIWGDAHRLEIVFTNLVSNAVKFTQVGGRVRVRTRSVASGVRIEVEDNGAGIPERDLSRVFERFFQVGAGDRRREGGVGIGLALAKELVELHGGEIDVKSKEGEFTRFSVFLPFGRDHIRPDVVERRHQFDESTNRQRRTGDGQLAISGSLEDDERGAENLGAAGSLLIDGGRRARILLVEDNADVREFVASLLARDCDVGVAANGQEGLDRLQSERPDLVISDVMMPVMSGTELCRIMKSDENLRSIPVILLTARVGSEATLEAYSHGADDFVAKPFHPSVLIARIRAQLRIRALGLQLAQQEKLAVIGTLAAGVLHEVRNPLNAILNAARVLAAGIADEGTARQLVGVVTDGAKRIENIAAALDTHARPAEQGEHQTCDLREGIDATLLLIHHRMDGVTVHRDYRTDLPAAVVAGPVNQVFMNLFDNSLRAGAANLWITLCHSGEFLEVEVSDDGTGIAAEDAKRIFDPFFTKRADGSGTGLGLYISRKMIAEQGGNLWYRPRPGGGATFIVEVPAAS